MPVTQTLDLTGLKCPVPIVRLSEFIKELGEGEECVATADDLAFCLDVEAWCRKTGHELLDNRDNDGTIVATIRKRSG